MKSIKTLGLASLLMFAAGTANATGVTFGFSAEFIDRGTQSAPEDDIFGITNTADLGSGIQIVSITIDMSTADDNLDDLFPNDTPHAPVFDTEDGCSPDYCYGSADGSPITGGFGAGAVGFVPLTAAEQAATEESTSVTLNFTDFDPGEVFFFTTDVDDVFDFRSSGREFAFSTISVTFDGGALGGPITLVSNYGADPADFWRAVAAASDKVVIPVPAGVWLLISGLGVLAARRRRS